MKNTFGGSSRSNPNYRSEADRKVAPVVRPADDVLVSMEQLRASLTSIASYLAPLNQRLDALEKRLKEVELKPLGTQIHANEVAVGGATRALAEMLGRPRKLIYDGQGKLIGARRVESWEE